MIAEVGEKWEIDKLDGSSWPIWKFRMQHLPMAKEVWEYVEETVPPPGDDAAAQAKPGQGQSEGSDNPCDGNLPHSDLFRDNMHNTKQTCGKLSNLGLRGIRWLTSCFSSDSTSLVTKMREGQSAQDHDSKQTMQVQ